MSQLLGGEPAVHHVVVKSVQQLDVHVAHQSIKDFLQRKEMFLVSVLGDRTSWSLGFCYRRKGGPGLVARGEESEASRTFDLLPELGSVRVDLSGGGSDHAQGGVDVHQRQSCNNTSQLTANLHCVFNQQVLCSTAGSYLQDSPSPEESSRNQDSTRR